MDPQNTIFRKAALDRLSSPEQLDQLMQVTTPKSWVALAACCALVLTALLWSVLGSIPSKVSGRGILIRKGGVFMATSRGDGNVVEIFVQPGQLVTNSQVLAEVSQPELKLRIEQNEDLLRRLRQEYAQFQEFQAQEQEHETATFAKQKEIYDALIRDYNTQIDWLNERIQAQTELQKKELVTQAQVLDTRIKLFSVQHDREQASIQRRQIDITELQARERRRQQLLGKENDIKLAENQHDYLRNLYKLNTIIVSPFQGHVLEIMVREGRLISANAPILSLQSDDKHLVARLFLSPADGKSVSVNMPVAISPVSVKREEYGFVIGRVTSVSEFPATPQGMLGVLENQALVNEFSQGGAPIEVSVALEADTNTHSGFRWSSVKGPPLRLTSGTLCDGLITVTNQRPISLVLPILRKTAGL